ncbi:MAG: class I SAM-dependent methyltransferase [Bryobacteraceae bacterium]
MRKIYVIGIALASAATLSAWYWRDRSDAEAERLTGLLGWQPGQTVAEVGAGAGKIAFHAARRVEPGGKVLATELDPKRLVKLRTGAAKRHLTGITVIEGSVSGTNLPDSCCDSIYLRGVYHHFTKSIEMDTSLYRALRPGGLLAVIEFPPSWFLSMIAPVKGVPGNRGGHGIPRNVLVQELKTAGFQIVEQIENWPAGLYCVVGRKGGLTRYHV